MNLDRFHADVLDYNKYENAIDDRHEYIFQHIENNVVWNSELVSQVISRSYSLDPLIDDTTYTPTQQWTNYGFKYYLDYDSQHSLYLDHVGEIFATHYLFCDLLRNIAPLYRRKYRPFEAIVYQYLDLRNEYWQSLPF